MDYFKRTSVLNGNSVLLARHFHFRAETFMKEIVNDDPLENLSYYSRQTWRDGDIH